MWCATDATAVTWFPPFFHKNFPWLYSYFMSKANQKLGFIKRNLKASPQELKRLAYISLVQSGMEYASTVWDPHLSKDKDSMERVQRRAAVGSQVHMTKQSV